LGDLAGSYQDTRQDVCHSPSVCAAGQAPQKKRGGEIRASNDVIARELKNPLVPNFSENSQNETTFFEKRLIC